MNASARRVWQFVQWGGKAIARASRFGVGLGLRVEPGRGLLRTWLLWLAAGMLPAASVMAQQDRPIMLLVGGDVRWDSNFFRVPNDLARSEQITSAYVGLSIEKQYAQQQFNLRVTQGTRRYKNFSYLNFNPLDFDGAWRWHVTPRVSGSLAYERTQALANFEDTRDFRRRIIRTTEVGAFSLDGELGGGWHLLAGIPYNSQANSEFFPQQASYREVGIGLGIQYVARSGNSITFNQRNVRGKYNDRVLFPPLQLDTGYRQRVSEFLGQWQVNGKSSISARLGWLTRDSDNFATRDVSDALGNFTYSWKPTAKLALNAAVARDLSPYEDVCSSYRVNDTLRLGSSWQISMKTALRASVNWSNEKYRGPLAICTLPARHDETNGAQLGAKWTPLRNAVIGASIGYQRRSSNLLGQTWDDTIAEVNASLRF